MKIKELYHQMTEKMYQRLLFVIFEEILDELESKKTKNCCKFD